jgi:DNA-binding NarL/FixJ family response regulator
MAIWVYSPVRAMHDALTAYVSGLGFEVQDDATKAREALLDLASYGTSLPPAPGIPSVALLGASHQSLVDTAHRLGYEYVHRPIDGEARLVEVLTLLTARMPMLERDGAPRATPADADGPQLTPREAQVMGLLIRGLPNKRIARHLGITERTAKFHVTALMRKYGAEGRLALVMRSQERMLG